MIQSNETAYGYRIFEDLNFEMFRGEKCQHFTSDVCLCPFGQSQVHYFGILVSDGHWLVVLNFFCNLGVWSHWMGSANFSLGFTYWWISLIWYRLGISAGNACSGMYRSFSTLKDPSPHWRKLHVLSLQVTQRRFRFFSGYQSDGESATNDESTFWSPIFGH